MMPKCFKIFLAVILSLCASFNEAAAQETLSWQDCIAEAVKNHPDLIAAQASVKQSEAGKNISASVLYPQIDSSLGVSTEKTTKTTDTYTYGVTGTQLLFDGFKAYDNIKAASENIKAARYNYKFVSTEVRLRLRAAFINLLKAQELLNITNQIYNIRKSNLELITLRYESGMEHKGALLTADANLSQAGFDIEQARRALEVAQRQLLKEMGRTKFSPLHAEGSFDVSDAAKEKPDFEILAQNNPSLGKLIAQKNAASFGIKAAEADYLPKLSARVGADKTSSRWPPENEQWNAGLTLSFPLFEGGLRSAEVAQAKSIFNQAQANALGERNTIIAALEQTWAAFQDTVETVDVQKKFLDAAGERSNIAQSQYSTGFISFDNWIIIEDNLVAAKKAFLQAQANALIAEAGWIQAKGETLEYE